MAKLFYLFTRRRGGNFYVQFRMDDGSLSNHKSTGTPNYNEARKIAMQWYSSGQIPERINSKSEKHKMTELEKVQLIKQLKIYDFEYEDIQTIVDILVSRNYLVSGILKATPESRQAVEYLLEFWDYDKSPYREERAVLGKNLSYSYFETALGRVKKYWASRLANLLAMYTGMRADEVQALRVCDIHDNYIWISHGWDDHVGLKPPKNGEERPAPISEELRDALLHIADFNPRRSIYKENSFVFFGKNAIKPVNQRLFNKYLNRALEDCGYPNPEKIRFHCWRHAFCTEVKTLINDDRY